MLPPRSPVAGPAAIAFPLLISLLLVPMLLFSVREVRGMAWFSSEAEATAAWGKIATVLTHPRCLNCHQENAPLQGDKPRIHIPRVVRGQDNLGVTVMRCTNCHRESNYDAAGVPGAPHWSLAPPSTNWQGLSSTQICAAIKDKERNGGKSLEDLVKHMKTDPLVLWAWSPGKGREAVPIAHKEFMDLVRLWAGAGGPCPK